METILAYPIASLIFGFIALVAAALVIPNPFRDALRLKLGIGVNKALKVNPIDEEMALIAKEEKIVEDGRRQASNLKGTLNNEKNKLTQMQADLAQANSDYNLAASMADAPKPGQDAAQLKAMVDEQLDNVSGKQAEVDAQTSVVTNIQATVNATYDAVTKATAKLGELQRTAKSHEAKAKATAVANSAATVLESYKGMNSVGAKINAAGDKVNEGFEQAQARLNDAKGPQAQQDFEAAKADQSREALRAKLEASRKGTTPAAAATTTPKAQ